MNVTTASRHHILERVLAPVFVTIPTAIIFHVPPVTIAILSLIPHAWLYFTHANIDLGFGPFWWLLVSPNYHRVHHSLAPEHIDRNFVNWFPLWDILFGTAVLPRWSECPSTGVAGVSARTLQQAYLLPFKGGQQMLSDKLMTVSRARRRGRLRLPRDLKSRAVLPGRLTSSEEKSRVALWQIYHSCNLSPFMRAETIIYYCQHIIDGHDFGRSAGRAFLVLLSNQKARRERGHYHDPYFVAGGFIGGRRRHAELERCRRAAGTAGTAGDVAASCAPAARSRLGTMGDRRHDGFSLQLDCVRRVGVQYHAQRNVEPGGGVLRSRSLRLLLVATSIQQRPRADLQRLSQAVKLGEPCSSADCAHIRRSCAPRATS
jgi:hypothetical protein